VHIWKSVANVSAPFAGGYDVILNTEYASCCWLVLLLVLMVAAPAPFLQTFLVICRYNRLSWYLDNTATDWQVRLQLYLRVSGVSSLKGSWCELLEQSVLFSIREFRCLLNRRCVAAAPVDNPMARAAPTGPGSCLAQ